MPDTAPDLSWLGPQGEPVAIKDGNRGELIYLTNSSFLGLDCDVFGKRPADLNCEDRIDHVGEIYSPPRVTKEARKQGLRAHLALGLGFDYWMGLYYTPSSQRSSKLGQEGSQESTVQNPISLAVTFQFQKRPRGSCG